jgi:LysM repeat protein
MRWNEITIQNGDSLSVLAERYNTDVSTLQIANNLTGVSIRAGKLLLVPVNGALSAAIPESDSTSLAYRNTPWRFAMVDCEDDITSASPNW